MSSPTGTRSAAAETRVGRERTREFWRRQPLAVRRAVPAVLIAGLLVGLALANQLQRSAEVWILATAVVAFFLSRSAYAGFWLGLEKAGVAHARARWEKRPPFLQRAVPPVVIAALVILIAWAAGIAPDSGLLGLLVITYALYLLPRPVRRYVLPVAILALAAAYPYFVQQTDYQRFLFKLPIFNAFPNMDTMVGMIIFAMMAIGLNMDSSDLSV